MGLYFWTLLFQPHSKGLIFLIEYIPFVYQLEICKSYEFWRWDTKEPLLDTIMPRASFSPNLILRNNAYIVLDFSTAVTSFLPLTFAYWAWLQHFWFCFFYWTLSNLVHMHPLIKIQQICRFYFLCLI